ncbi:hypothetical protein OEG86_23890 [Hoeflea alexandrii]|uniref:hypothetical protein n=1 Tax=Hoeflea alexandrii TaxID=288436 RepID=UPI002270DA65|nr:hypothetical protein [Hoeflea alexandrii]MCY0154758.1 hypothetical protein [Hoeflea alexandrii]
MEADQQKLELATQAASAALEAARSNLETINVEKSKARAELSEANDRKNDILRQIASAKEELANRQREITEVDANSATPGRIDEKSQEAEPAQ